MNKGNMRDVTLLIGLASVLCGIEANILDNIQSLFQQSIIGENIDQLVKEVTTSQQWEAINPKELEKVAKDGLQQILREGQDLSPRIKTQIDLLIAKTEQNKDNILRQIRQSSLSDSMATTLTDNLPDPDTWDVDFIGQLGTEPLKKIPNNVLLQVTDKEAIAKMLTQTKALYSSEGNRITKSKLKDLITNLTYLLATDIENWKESDFNDFPTEEITPELVSRMDSNLVKVVQEKLATESRKRNECDLGRSVVKKLLEGKITDESTFTEFGVFFDDLGSELQKYIYPEDVKEDIRYVDFIERVLKQNTKTCMEKGQASGQSISLLRLSLDEPVTAQVIGEEGACAVGVMTLSAVNSSLSFLNDGQLKELDKCINGADGTAKRISMVVNHENKQPLERSTQYSHLPESLINLGTRFGKVQDNEALNILRKDDLSLKDSQAELLMSKVNSGSLSVLSPMAKANMPYSKLKSTGVNELGNIASDMVGQSLVCVTGSMKAFSDRTIISLQLLKQYKTLLRCMSRIDAQKIDNTTSPFVIAKELRSERLSTPLAMDLRDRMIETTVSSSAYDAMKKFTISDIDNMPVAVVAAFGSDISALGEKEREFLLIKLGKMEEPGEIPVVARKMIVEQGLNTKNRGNSLNAGDLSLVGEAVLQIPANLIQNANQVTKLLFLTKVNEDIRDGKLSIMCISQEMTGAIAKCISDVYGEPSKLDSISNIDGLMWAPSWNYIKAINKEVLDQATRRLPPMTYAMTELGEYDCLSSNGMYYLEALKMEKNLDIMQKKSLITILEKDVSQGTKRASKTITLSPCEKGRILGVDNMNTNDLDNMNSEDVQTCIQYLGMTEMSEFRAQQYLVKKLLAAKNNDPSRLTELELTKTGHAFRGFSASDIEKMTSSFFKPDKPLTTMIGSLSLSNSQIQAVASKIKNNINTLAGLTGKELVSLGNILGGFSVEDLQQMRYQSAEEAMPTCKRLECQSDNLKDALPFLLDRVYGNPENIDASMMREMGHFVAKLTSDNIKKIKPQAYGGITPAGIKGMNTNQIKSIMADGFGNLPYESGMALSAGQINSLNNEQRTAALTSRRLKGMASATTASLLFVSLSIVVTVFL